VNLTCLTLLSLASLAGGPTPISIPNAGFEELYLVNNNLPASYGGVVPVGSFPTGDPPAGWSPYPAGGLPAGAFLGVLNPGVQADFPPGESAFFPAGAPEGSNAVLLYFSGAAGGAEFGVTQTLVETLQPHTRYTLRVEVGNIASGTGLSAPYDGFGFFDLRGFPGYRIELRAGGELLVSDDNTLVTVGNLEELEGVFQPTALSVETGAGHTALGEPLEIRLISLNQPDVPGVTGIEVDFDDVRLTATPVAPDPPTLPFPLLVPRIALMLGIFVHPL